MFRRILTAMHRPRPDAAGLVAGPASAATPAARAALAARVAGSVPAGQAALAPLALLTTLAATPPLPAQEGAITYTHSVKLDMELPPEIAGMKAQFPEASTSTWVLRFGPSGSLMTEAGDLPEVGSAGKKAVSFPGPNGVVAKEVPVDVMLARMPDLMMFMGAPGTASVVQHVYEDYAAGTVVETREFLGRTFRINGERPTYRWRVTTDHATHLGYPVMKATTEHDSTTVEAWFTPAIPLPGGPAAYGGLPGMILVLSLNDGHTQYQATEVTLGALEEGLIRPPDRGREVTREEFEKIVADKIEEIRMLKGPRQMGAGGKGRRDLPARRRASLGAARLGAARRLSRDC